jgi:hypothetical protein
MGPVKRALLGSAAGVFAVSAFVVSASEAADLVVKAKPVEYVRVCSLYGAGFWYVPGTDTCIKIGAFVRTDLNINAGGNGNPTGFGGSYLGGLNSDGDVSGRNTRTDTGPLAFRNRMDLGFDLRTQTEYGVLRSYFDVGTRITVGTGDGGLNTIGNAAQSTLYASRAFIQFAGFTAGRIRSFFDMFSSGKYTLAEAQASGDTFPYGLYGIAYTKEFGGGLSASLSFEDGGFATNGRGRTTENVNLIPGGTVAGGFMPQTTSGSWVIGNQFNDIKGQTTLDPVLNVRLDQGWGYAGVSAALHDASGGYYGTSNSTLNGHPGDKYGWAVAGSFQLNDVFDLKGDVFGVMAVFSRGAIGYATQDFGPKTVFGSGNQVGLGWMTDGVYGTGTGIELTNVWSINSAYEHVWNPNWRTSLYGGFVGVSYDDAAKNMICTSPQMAAGLFGPGALAGGLQNNFGSCNPNFSYSQAGTRTLWNPVPDLDIALDLNWAHLNTAFAGTTAPGAVFQAGGARPAGTYTVKDQDVYAALFRVQRNFLY